MSQGMSLLDTESERSGYQRCSGMAIPGSTRCGAAREAARDVERHERATANEAPHNRPNHEQSDHVEDQVRKVGMKHGSSEQTPPLAIRRASLPRARLEDRAR